ncbi:hypothetical protein CLV63_11242 [Murinocardiopsis flavida]|uniref:Uncharacterized protein n=1 Tax=Murinocardiopsis flavida TaxID=645275 RepID=A0A2P8DG15_9ACTN|nr:hypothetical protein [Murinocardiopsis flavida]PSK96160.1 hypothetical protein CLV63_11242 [Murinocardiopsis flavida]
MSKSIEPYETIAKQIDTQGGTERVLAAVKERPRTPVPTQADICEDLFAQLADLLDDVSLGTLQITWTTGKFTKDPERTIRSRKASKDKSRPPMGTVSRKRPVTTRYTLTRYGAELREFHGANAAAEAFATVLGLLDALIGRERSPRLRVALTRIEQEYTTRLRRVQSVKCPMTDFMTLGRTLADG